MGRSVGGGDTDGVFFDVGRSSLFFVNSYVSFCHQPFSLAVATPFPAFFCQENEGSKRLQRLQGDHHVATGGRPLQISSGSPARPRSAGRGGRSVCKGTVDVEITIPTLTTRALES